MVDPVDCTVVNFVEPWENDFEKWIVHGVRQGFCSPIYCENHDGVHLDDMEEWDDCHAEYDDRDFCWPIVRIR